MTNTAPNGPFLITNVTSEWEYINGPSNEINIKYNGDTMFWDWNYSLSLSKVAGGTKDFAFKVWETLDGITFAPVDF